MKTNKFLALVLGLVAVFFITSCVEDDDYVAPEVLVPAVDTAALGEKITFASVIQRHLDAVDVDGDGSISNDERNNQDNVVGIFSPEFERNLYIEGYVVSSDATGNFFEEVIIQNTTDENAVAGDPRRGIKLSINDRDLANFYNFGRKVYFRLTVTGGEDIAIGLENGVYTLGKTAGQSIEALEPFEYKDYVIRDPEVATITPKIITIDALEEEDENTLIQFQNVQIIKTDKDKTYAGELADQFDGFRIIESCDSDATIRLQTSTFADFKSVTVDNGRGTITGIYSRDFRDDFNTFIINDLEAIAFSNPDRCDPIVLECDGPSGGDMTIFSENFEGFSNYTAEGWTMTNVNGGSVDWFISSFSGNNYSRISAFRSNETDAEVWLVTPDINLDATTEEELNFEAESAFYNQNILTVFVSEDFTGDVTTATWTQIEANIPTEPASGNFSGLMPAGPINISCLEGSVNFAFVYNGSDPSATTRYHVDNVEVTGK